MFGYLSRRSRELLHGGGNFGHCSGHLGSVSRLGVNRAGHFLRTLIHAGGIIAHFQGHLMQPFLHRAGGA